MIGCNNSIHKPVAFDPADYEYVGAWDSGDTNPGRYMGTPSTFTMDDGTQVEGNNWTHAYETWLRGLLRASRTSRFDDRWACDHCGARLRYVAVLRHTPTGDHIAAGETCLDGRFALASKAQFDALRKASAEARAEHRILNSCKRVLDANPDLRDIIFPVPDKWAGTRAHEILSDIARKFRKYGDLSERQIAFVRQLPAQAEEQLARAALRAAEKAAADPAPSGKVEVTGEIVGLKWQDNDFGGTYKMTVKTAGGWCVFVTVPSSLDEVERGRKVSFTATLTPSEKDPTFAFGKRPSKARYIDDIAKGN